MIGSLGILAALLLVCVVLPFAARAVYKVQERDSSLVWLRVPMSGVRGQQVGQFPAMSYSFGFAEPFALFSFVSTDLEDWCRQNGWLTDDGWFDREGSPGQEFLVEAAIALDTPRPFMVRSTGRCSVRQHTIVEQFRVERRVSFSCGMADCWEDAEESSGGTGIYLCEKHRSWQQEVRAVAALCL